MPLQQPELILASASPRRRAMLRAVHAPFRSVAVHYREDNERGRRPHMLVMRHARAKAAAAAQGLRRGVVIGADTLVWLDGKALGKPRTRHEAQTMLQRLQGRTHAVYTGVALYDARVRRWCVNYVRTMVTMRRLSMHEILHYLTLINPLDKAGAYAIQEAGGIIIERIQGCFYNVLGFPVAMLEEMLQRLGYSLMTPRRGVGRARV
jgi:septum formation protein